MNNYHVEHAITHLARAQAHLHLMEDDETLTNQQVAKISEIKDSFQSLRRTIKSFVRENE
jgi:lipopolysaccharide biosynthesis protein